ncbi:AsmA-like C-terminal domain-containing protein [Sulfuricurvum sp.]|uniref:YhdP family protein n=1 Tax=Sulfuricurvum sp. TaxID=2025608 RepID=UPI00356A0246
MNDKIIIRVIPKIHFRIGLFLAFVFLVFFFTFIALLEGIRVDRLKLGAIKIEELYLKWDNALLISASKIDLSDLKRDNTPLTLEPLSKLPSIIRIFEAWVEKVNINTIQYKDISASVNYTKGSLGKIVLHQGLHDYPGKFSLNDKSFYLILPQIRFMDANISGKMSIKLKEQTLIAHINLALPQTPQISITAVGNTDTLTIVVDAEHEFTTIRPLIRFLGVDPQISPWIVDYAKASSLSLHTLHGKFHYNKPEELLNNLRAEATVISGEYTFAQGFEPIKAPNVDLKFTDGKLYIYPKSGTFYGLPTEQSYLYIDFTTPHTMLDAFIRTHHAKLNDPILNLLHFYKIDLPLKQQSGECDVDLHLCVNLYSLDTTAKGIFQPTASDILLGQVALRSENGIVSLNNTHVSFDHFIAHYGNNIADARVDGEYDAHNGRGIVSIAAYKVSPIGKDKYITLFDTRDPLRVDYIIAPDHDTLNVMPSTWNVLGEKLKIDPFRTPFDYHRAYTAVQTVPFTISDKIRGHFNAVFDGTAKQTDVRLTLDALHIREVVLRNAPLNIDLHYNDALSTVHIPNLSSWTINQLPVQISPLNASLKGDDISYDRIGTVFGDILKGNLSGKYHLDSQKGNIHVSNMVAINPKLVPLMESKESIDLALDASGDEINLNAETLKAHFTTIPNGWKISLSDIALLSNKSPLLRHYNINNGYLNLFYTGESSRYGFDGEINYPYALMVINDQPISRYHFSGTYQENQYTMRVNDRIMLTQTPSFITIRANNAGINMPQLTKFLSDHQQKNTMDSNQSSTSLPIHINGTDTYLYLMKGRKIVADTLDATLHNDDLDATLHHMQGSATLKMRDGFFYIDGHEFNDTFMEHLFMFSDFKGGSFSFQAKGDSDSFDGIMRVENTILKDYKVLNNVLAFVNTIPSLATFSLPNYNTQGLPVKEGYAHYSYNKGILNVDNFTLNSPEMKILGEGHANINTQTLLGTLTLKTDLGAKLSKVPMVGYILFGEDGSISTTVTINGKLDDPKVETAIAKEIVTAPFNILKRTLVYPFLWMIPDEKKK